MKILGFNESSHDAAISIIENDKILFAAHAERYSKQKNDWYNNPDIWKNALSFGDPDIVAYYEKPLLKKLRLITKGGSSDWKPRSKYNISFKHHYSHACAGYYTSPFDKAAIVVIDAMGEFSTSTVWSGNKENIKLIKEIKYPLSFGLFYTAFTQLVGLKPNEHEYILMGMAGYGNPDRYYKKVLQYFPSIKKQKYNYHTGILDWNEPITEQDKFDIAAAVQKVYELRLWDFMCKVRGELLPDYDNLVFMGGCALNASANTMLWDIFKNIWIMPNPGDAGSSLGAALAAYGKHVNWDGPYLGYDLGGEYPVDEILNEIINNKIVAVACGRAEFGPRALGNRSILADPRDPDIKDKVNLIKQRELFRPFAPVVMAEHASEWFDMNYESPYMQFTPKCLKPDIIPSVVHIDGTSRVQTVNRKQHPGLYNVLKKFYNITGVPILLNTSLNIKGQPLLNDEIDVNLWEKEYETKILRGTNVK
jgi:carbamoyltransferase